MPTRSREKRESDDLNYRNALGYLRGDHEERIPPYADRVKVRFTEHVNTMSKQTLSPKEIGQGA